MICVRRSIKRWCFKKSSCLKKRKPTYPDNMEKIKILSVNISEKKGTIKVPVDTITLTSEGINGDAHAGMWHRQVSLLGKESLDKMTPTIGREPVSYTHLTLP